MNEQNENAIDQNSEEAKVEQMIENQMVGYSEEDRIAALSYSPVEIKGGVKIPDWFKPSTRDPKERKEHLSRLEEYIKMPLSKTMDIVHTATLELANFHKPITQEMRVVILEDIFGKMLNEDYPYQIIKESSLPFSTANAIVRFYDAIKAKKVGDSFDYHELTFVNQLIKFSEVSGLETARIINRVVEAFADMNNEISTKSVFVEIINNVSTKKVNIIMKDQKPDEVVEETEKLLSDSDIENIAESGLPSDFVQDGCDSCNEESCEPCEDAMNEIRESSTDSE